MTADTKHGSQVKLHMYTVHNYNYAYKQTYLQSYTPLSNPPTLMLFY